jgi:cardiolipin-specific phospholipase
MRCLSPSARAALEVISRTKHTRLQHSQFATATTSTDDLYIPPHSRHPPTMSTPTAPDSDGEVNARSQRSPLASQRAKEEGKNPRRSRVEGMFPMTYKEGFSQWWSALPAAKAEHKVLSYVPYLRQPPTHTKTGSEPPTRANSIVSINPDAPLEQTTTTTSIEDPYGPRTWRSRLVPLSGKNRALNEFSVERTGETPDQNLVILHGYGAGLGFFYKNFEPLSRPKGWQLYALDMLGMGRSSRPPFKLKSRTRETQVTEAEDWFIDSLEEWRVQKKIDKFTLIGHSMGGYMAVCYALKYPGRLNKLILASPVGIPEDPYATQAPMPPAPDVTESIEPRKSAEEELKQKANPNRLPAGRDGETTAPPRRPYARWLTYLWDANISPFSFVRWAGPLGPRLVSGWTSRRFSHLPPEEALALHDYSYSLFRLRGSGEYALAYILAPGAFARSPLIRRIGGIGRQPLEQKTHEVDPQGQLRQNPESATPANPSTSTSGSEASVEPGLPVVLMYGENDWMDVKGGYAAKRKLDEATKKALANATPEQKARDQGSSKVLIVKNAGHHLYLDGPDEFNKMILKEMEDVRKQSRTELQSK